MWILYPYFELNFRGVEFELKNRQKEKRTYILAIMENTGCQWVEMSCHDEKLVLVLICFILFVKKHLRGTICKI